MAGANGGKRNRRAYNDLVDRLHQWGLWVEEPLNGLSYSSQSHLVNSMEYGCSVSGGRRATINYRRHRLESEVDRAVAELREPHRVYIRYTYIQNMKPDAVSREMDVSERTIYRYSDIAHTEIAKYLKIKI